MFDEFDDKYEEIITGFGIVLNMLSRLFDISFKAPVRDVASRLLSETNEFNPILEKGEVPAGD